MGHPNMTDAEKAKHRADKLAANRSKQAAAKDAKHDHEIAKAVDSLGEHGKKK